MSVHRYRSEIAAQNVANIDTPGYRRQEVDLRAADFRSVLDGASSGFRNGGPTAVGGRDASEGAVRVAGVRRVDTGEYGERQARLLAATDMMAAKSAFELSVKTATLLKSMALSSLEIGRGS